MYNIIIEKILHLLYKDIASEIRLKPSLNNLQERDTSYL
jgi:hypothetical protein